jgi:DNA-binding SARP family transcriptional activator/LysM repeat protein
MRRTTNLLRVAAAAAALALLLLGVPALLVTAVGWPLPRQLPTFSTIGDTLTGREPLETATVWKVLAVICWLAWLQIVVAAVVETVASARGALPTTIPGFSLAHGLVAPLVAAIVVAWPAATTTGRAAATPAPSAELVSATVPRPAVPTATVVPRAETPAPVATVEHVVQRRDTLWDLAERYLGDGYRARELFDLNQGRPQPDGATLTDPSVIRPGWTLQIPAPAARQAAPDAVTVQPGDTLWGIAERELGDGHRFAEIVDLNQSVTQPDGRRLDDPQVIEPGWVLQLPGTKTTARAVPQAQPPSSEPPLSPVPPSSTAELPPAGLMATPAMPDSEVKPVRPAEVTDPDDDQRSLPALGLIGGSIATAGLLTLLHRRRRAQLRRRDRHQVPPPLTPELQAAEAALRAGADVTSAARLDAALRAAGSVEGPNGHVAVDHCEVRNGLVSFTMHDSTPAGHGPGPTDPGGSSFDPDEDRSVLTETAPRMPALVPVGVDRQGRSVLVDLEAPAITTITGDPTAARRLLNSIAVAAATSPWSDHSRVLYVGAPPIAVDDLEAAPSLEEALDDLESRARRGVDALDAAGFTTVADARAAGITPDLWTPLVVIAPEQPSTAALDRLRQIAAATPTCIALALYGDDPLPGRVIAIDADGAASIDGQPAITAHLLAEEELTHLGALIELTDTPCVPAPDFGTEERPRRTTCTTGEVALEELLGDVDVLIRVLGEVEALQRSDGREERLKPPKQKSLEALTYLALREERVDREDLQAALWPAGDNSAKTFHNTIWAARKMLTDIGNPELFPEPAEGHYVLGDGVSTDYELFHELVARAEEAEDPDLAANLLAEALTLVRGEPFTGVGRGYSWAAPHAGLIVAQVVDAAEELGEIRLAAGDWRGAEWAARQGLLVFPCDERLYRLLMRAAHASGNIPAVHRAFDELAAVVADPDDGVEPDDTLHPETITLLDELTGSRPRTDRATA